MAKSIQTAERYKKYSIGKKRAIFLIKFSPSSVDTFPKGKANKKEIIMYSIGQVSQMFDLPVSTLRYYDKEGLFNDIKRESGMRKFSDKALESLRMIECLKKSGLEIKDIKQYMTWCQEGSKTYPQRKEMFEKQKVQVEAEIEKLNKTLAMLNFKCWYYDTAIKDGNEDGIHAMLPDKLPTDIQELYDYAHKD